MVTLLKFVHKCRARWGGGAEPARRPDGLGRFFFTGVAEEHWDVYPHLDEITVSRQRMAPLILQTVSRLLVSTRKACSIFELRLFLQQNMLKCRDMSYGIDD